MVPEDLGELRAAELAALGRIAPPRDLSRAHPGLARLLRSEVARRVKAAASRWRWDEARFDAPLAQRQLRLLSGLLAARCSIGDTALDLRFSLVGSHRTEMRGGVRLPARDLPARTPLRLAVTEVRLGPCQRPQPL